MSTGITISEKINRLFQKKEWLKARNLILKELEKKPSDHWLLTRLSTTYSEERNYEKALEYSSKAIMLAPRCPLALWDYAGDLDMTKKYKSAIHIWKRLLKLGTDKIAYGQCGEGKRWALSLLNDCRYRIGNSYNKLGRKKLAAKYIEYYIANRANSIKSIYNLRAVKKELNMLTKQTGRL